MFNHPYIFIFHLRHFKCSINFNLLSGKKKHRKSNLSQNVLNQLGFFFKPDNSKKKPRKKNIGKKWSFQGQLGREKCFPVISITDQFHSFGSEKLELYWWEEVYLIYCEAPKRSNNMRRTMKSHQCQSSTVTPIRVKKTFTFRRWLLACWTNTHTLLTTTCVCSTPVDKKKMTLRNIAMCYTS